MTRIKASNQGNILAITLLDSASNGGGSAYPLQSGCAKR